MFKITGGKGFMMGFANGWTVSVQWGIGNYCQNQNATWAPDGSNSSAVVGQIGSNDAEIAAWDKDGNWYNFGNDTVKGYVKADDVVSFMTLIANQ